MALRHGRSGSNTGLLGFWIVGRPGKDGLLLFWSRKASTAQAADFLTKNDLNSSNDLARKESGYASSMSNLRGRRCTLGGALPFARQSHLNKPADRSGHVRDGPLLSAPFLNEVNPSRWRDQLQAVRSALAVRCRMHPGVRFDRLSLDHHEPLVCQPYGV